MDPEAAGSGGSPSPIERLEQAEKVAEAFVQRRIKPALRRAQQAQLGDLLRDSGAYLKGLWVRLNGGGRSGRRSGLEALGLPVPLPTLRDSEVVGVGVGGAVGRGGQGLEALGLPVPLPTLRDSDVVSVGVGVLKGVEGRGGKALACLR